MYVLLYRFFIGIRRSVYKVPLYRKRAGARTILFRFGTYT
jgi:hypothetical protein